MRTSVSLWGVSEALGTILLLLSSTIAGAAILIFVTNHPTKEVLEIERFSSEVVEIGGVKYITITHIAGKPLPLGKIQIIVSTEGTRDVFEGTDCEYLISRIGVWDGDSLWEIGETYSHSMTSLPPGAEKVEVRVLNTGEGGGRVLYRYTNMVEPKSATKADLSVEDLYLQRYGRRLTLLVKDSIADIYMVISNNGGVPVQTSTLQIFLYLDGNLIRKMPIAEAAEDGDGVVGTPPDQLLPGHSITLVKRSFTTSVLGSHTLLARVLPPFEGEARLYNNERTYQFNVTIQQYFSPGQGPNPAVSIDDIFFSNRYPKRGEEVTITVYVKNLGPSPVLPSHHLLFVMSLYPIKQLNLGENRKVLSWIDDVPEVPEGVDPQDWASSHGQSLYGNDTTFPTVKIRNFAIPASGKIAFQFRWVAELFEGSNIVPIYFAVDCDQRNYTVPPVDQLGTPPEEVYTFLDGDKDEDNLNLINIQVTPKILVVDDDGASTGSSDDRTTIIVEALSGAGITPDIIFVASQVRLLGEETYIWAPKFNYPSPTEVPVPALEEYDVIIWIVGENPSPVLYHNLADIEACLNNDQKIWIIGRGVLEGAFDSSIPDLSSYTPVGTVDAGMKELLYDYTYLKSLYLDASVADRYYGVRGDNVTDPEKGLMNLNFSSDEGITFSEVGYRDEGDFPNGVSPAGRLTYDLPAGEGSTYIEAGVETPFYRILWSFFDYTTITYLNERINLAASVLKWFGWEIEIGDDLAIVRMEIELPEGVETPKYMDDILIRVWVRNNGPTAVSTTVIFYVIGEDNIERRIPSRYPDGVDNPQDIVNLPGNGGEEICTKTWRATLEGRITFRAVVDPFRILQEVNENNNDLSYSPTTITSIVIEKRILLIDDDESYSEENETFSNWDLEGGVAPPPSALREDLTHKIAEQLELYGYSYDLYRVVNTYSGSAYLFSDGPDIETLMRYTSVIWVLPEEEIDPLLPETLTADDRDYLIQYLTKSYEESVYLTNVTPKLVVISGCLFTDILGAPGSVSDPFLYRHMGVGTFTGRTGYTTITGTSDDSYLLPFHGLEGTFLREVYGEGVEGRAENPLFGEESVSTTLYGVGEAGQTPLGILHSSEDQGYLAELISIPFQIGTANSDGIVEMLFGLFRDLNLTVESPEIVSRAVDINVSGTVHQLGDVFLIKTLVANLGGAGGSFVVRLYDGDLILKTDAIYIPPGGVATVETTWIPTLAGQRVIMVKADYYQDVEEVFEGNNNPFINVPVYFFFDDLEDTDASSWEHEATIVRINGENALEFLDETQEQYTNIVKDWSEANGFNSTSRYSHSASFSFWSGQEPPPPLDVVICMDTSSSMSGDPIAKLKVAAKALVAQLSDQDRVALMWYAGSGNVHNVSFTQLTESGRAYINSQIDSMTPKAITQIWDMSGAGISYAYYGHAAGHVPAVVILSDGVDRLGDDSEPPEPDDNNDLNTLERGSNRWCPWHSFGQVVTYTSHFGKYGGDASSYGFWYTVTFPSPTTRNGLLNAPLPVFTIGLNLEHHSPPNSPSTSTKPAEKSVNTYAYYTGGAESGTVEYNLWRMATTSQGGKYFYSPDENSLLSVFNTVAYELKKLQTLTRSSGAGTPTDSEQYSRGGTRAPACVEPGDRYIITEEFSLLGANSARLVYFQKYQMDVGSNGGVVLVGTSDDGTEWRYRYVIPQGQYSGNLDLESYRYDDYGREMRWVYNGVSAGGRYDWERVTVDLTPFRGKSHVKIMFLYLAVTWGVGEGWFIDDVEVRISRSDAQPPTSTIADQWYLAEDEVIAHSGSHFWSFVDPTYGLKPGADAALYLRPVDLTSAKWARLTFYVRFNINSNSGFPPDCLRVEISTDNWKSFRTLHNGVRIGWGVTGTEGDLSDGIADGKSYTGIPDDGLTAEEANYWVSSETLTRFQGDLTAYRGKTVHIRFRVVTNGYPLVGPKPYDHYEDPDLFKGVYLDDIVISGAS